MRQKSTLPRSWTTPSALCRIIEGLWSPPSTVDNATGSWSVGHSGMIAALLELVESVNQGILFETLSAEEGFRWFQHVAVLRTTLAQWQQGIVAQISFREVQGLHALLKICPDVPTPEKVKNLAFIKDRELRGSIARDIDSLDRLVDQEEWKVATVLAGSVIEALLLDGLSRRKYHARAVGVERTHVAAKTSGWSRPEPMDQWDLWKLVAIAGELGLIDGAVRGVCDGARSFRNLIHPGKERTTQPCDRATALTGLAGVVHLVRALKSL